MQNLKLILKIILRYIKSSYWFIRLIYRNRKFSVGRKIKQYFGACETIHILCPGSSLDLIKNASLEKNSLIIFVNHTINICDMKSFDGFKKISFSSDPQRAKEIITNRDNKLSKYMSVLCPNHLYHLNKEIFINYKYIFNILPSFSKQLGIVGRPFKDYQKIIPPYNLFRPFGYGSLNSATIFSLIFEPKQINFWGCDFYSAKTKLYSELAGGNKYAYNVNFSYYEEKTKKDFNTLKNYFDSKNIKFIIHNLDNN